MKLIVLCGIPGSGKTTLSKQIENEYGMTRRSFDELKIFHKRDFIPYIVDSLEKNEDVVADAPHTDLKTRLELLKSIEHIDCEKILIFLNLSFEECVHRNAQRHQPLPYFVVKSFYDRLEEPTLDEGWDEIIYYKGE